MSDSKVIAEALLGYPPQSMLTDENAARPTSVRLVEISLKRQQKMVIFYYSKVAWFDLAGDSIEEVAQRVATGWRPARWKAGKEKRRRSSLSLENKDDTYLMFILSDELDWQFSREAPCFSLLTQTSPSLRQYYINPVCFDRGGNKVGAWARFTECRVGCFIARGDKANSDQGGRNVDRFNIHVDLNEDSGFYTPIMIDPDVGYPEGTGPSG